MGEPQDASDHLAGAEAQHVVKQRIHEFLARRPKRGGIGGRGEHGARKSIAVRVLGPEGEKSIAEGSPEDLYLVENPRSMSRPVLAVRLVAELRVPTQQQISEE